MPSYRGRLPKDRPYQGIEVVVYNNSNIRVDVDVTDESGEFYFENLNSGNYQLRFFGGNYTEEDWQDIIVAANKVLEQYYIRPIDGTVIRNSIGELSFEIVGLAENGIQEILSTGDIKFYTKSSGGVYNLIEDTDTGVVSTDGYNLTIDSDFFTSTITIFAYDGQNEYDHITIADIEDGFGFTAWVNASSFVVTYNEELDEYNPSSITLTPNFAIAGNIIDVENDTDFTFTSSPAAPSGVSVNASTGVVTITSSSYFNSSDLYTAQWDATYVEDGTTYNVGVGETVYKAPSGVDARVLTISSRGQIFKSDQDDDISEPSEIVLTGLKQNISQSPKWEVLEGVGVTLRDISNTPITQNSTEIDVIKLTASDMDTNTLVRIRGYIDADTSSDYESGELFDEVTIARVKEGTNAWTLLVENENHTFPANSSGTIQSGDYSGANTGFLLYRGTQQFTYDSAGSGTDGTYRITNKTQTGISCNINHSTGELDTFTAMSGDTASVTVTITAYYNGTSTTFNKTLSYSKSKQGEKGDPGDDGQPGQSGPGILYVGEYSDLSSSRELNNDIAQDVVSHSDVYYAFIGTHQKLVSATTAPPGSDWEAFSDFNAISTGLLLVDKSFVKSAINVGTNAEGDAANITIFGENTNPYIAMGQAALSQGYDQDGIFLGLDSGIAKLSMKGANGAFKWDGTDLSLTGNITATGGVISGTLNMGDPTAVSIGPDAVFTDLVPTKAFDFLDPNRYGTPIVVLDETSEETGSISLPTSDGVNTLGYTKRTEIEFSIEFFNGGPGGSVTTDVSTEVFLEGSTDGGSTYDDIKKIADFTITSPSGSTFSDTIGITQPLQGFDDVRVKVVASRTSASTIVEIYIYEFTVVQYQIQTIINSNGVYSLVAPYRVVTLGDTGSSGGSGVVSINWADIEQKPNSESAWATETGFDNRYLQSYTETDPKGVSSASFSGTSTKTLTLTLNDSSTVTANFSDINTTYSAGSGIGLSGTTFSVSAGLGLSQTSTGLQVDGSVVRTAGTQTIGGAKTFTSNMIVQGTVTATDFIISGQGISAQGISMDAGSTLVHLSNSGVDIIQSNGLINPDSIDGGVASEWGQIGGTLSDQTDLQNALNAKVPTSRTLTINGTAYDLSQNRSWTISTGGTYTAGTGLSLASNEFSLDLTYTDGRYYSANDTPVFDKIGVGAPNDGSLGYFQTDVNNSAGYAFGVSANPGGIKIENDNATAGSYASIFFRSHTGGAQVFATTTGASNEINFGIHLDNSGNTNGYTRFFINGETGNTGIDTISPDYKFDVNGTGRFVGDVRLDSKLIVESKVELEYDPASKTLNFNFV